MSARWSEYMPLDDLVEAVRNVKEHDEALIAKSLDRFGYIEPVVLDERTGRIISGHGRRKDILSRRAAGAEPPDGVQVDGDGTWRVHVQRGWSSRDDIEAEAAAIALNNVGPSGGWTDELADVLQSLADANALDGIGFTSIDLEDLRALGEASAPSLDELRARHGEPDPKDFWPAFRLRCAPDVRARYLALVGALPEDDRLAKLVELAEKGAQGA